MSGSERVVCAAVMGLAIGFGDVAVAGPPAVAPEKRFDRTAIQRQLKQMVQTRRVRLARPTVTISTEQRVKICQEQLNGLASALAECLAANSDPVSPPPGSPLDVFNKLTNAQLAQKCPGSLQQCLDQVLDEQVAWCNANVCKSKADAVAAKRSVCDQLQALLAQELSQPPSLKNTTPPCPDLYQAYLKARDAVKNFQCGGGGISSLMCLGPLTELINAENAALQKLKENGCI